MDRRIGMYTREIKTLRRRLVEAEDAGDQNRIAGVRMDLAHAMECFAWWNRGKKSENAPND